MPFHKHIRGQRIETKTAFFLRYYRTTDGQRKKVMVKLADKSKQYRCWQDVEPLIARLLEISEQPVANAATAQLTIAAFVEQHYLPWVKSNKAAVTHQGYLDVWRKHWKDRVGHITLANLTTARVTETLTELAKAGIGRWQLGHVKWLMSAVYEWAKAQSIVTHNPVPAAKWLCKVARHSKQRNYSLAEVKAMLDILEPLDIRAAAALGLAYFAALRPCEIRGLQWGDYTGTELHVRRSVWRNHTGDPKTERSEGEIPYVIRPLRDLLEKLRAQQGELATADAPIPQNQNRKAISLDSLNWRLIAPAMKKAGINWRGFYPARRGMNTQVTNTSGNVLNGAGLLRNNPITALRHYTEPQRESIIAAQKAVEQQYVALGKETVQ